MIVDHAKKHRIAYMYYVELRSYLEIMRHTGVPIDFIREWCGKVINDKDLAKIYLPEEYYKGKKPVVLLGIFKGYYTDVSEADICTDIREIKYNKHNIEHEMPVPVFKEERMSFHEIISQEEFKVGRELNKRKPVIAESNINKKTWWTKFQSKKQEN